MRHLLLFRRLLGCCLLTVPVVLASLFVLPAGAQTLDEIATTIDENGGYFERELQSVALDAVERANDQGVGFVYLDQENAEDLPLIASELLQRLANINSPFRTLIVLDTSGVWVESLDRDTGDAADAALPQFAAGAIAGGIDTVLGVLGGESTSTDATSSNAAEATSSSAEPAVASSGGGVPWLLILVLGVIAFFAVRFFVGRKRKAAALEAALAEDRAEIRDQLRNNADHVIDLGDRIATADDELRRMYEEASQTFQDVSLGLEDAATAAEIDALDDRLDRAEWQFDVIEARLDGRTPPTEPRVGEGPIPRPSGRTPVPSLGGDGPALGPDESIFPGQRRPQRPAPRARQAPRRQRSGGALGGMLGGVAKAGLLSLVLRMLLGGGLSPSSGSRRTQQRISRGGRIGGGVLR